MFFGKVPLICPQTGVQAAGNLPAAHFPPWSKKAHIEYKRNRARFQISGNPPPLYLNSLRILAD